LSPEVQYHCILSQLAGRIILLAQLNGAGYLIPAIISIGLI
jgi:hypothetical protein